MKSTLVTIASMRENLCEAEGRVADWILSNPEKAPFQSVHALAEAAGVSVASVSRLAKRTGCRNFRDFKIRIAHDVSSPLSVIYEAIVAGDSKEEIVRKVFAGNMRGLEATLNILNVDDVLKAANLISKCNRVVFFGIASSGHIARDAALRFSMLGIRSYAFTDSVEALGRSMALTKGDIAVGISHSGRSNIPIHALRVATKNGAKTIAISNYPNSPIAKASDIFICTVFPESNVKAAALSSRVCQICVIDAIYLLVASSIKDLSCTTRINDLIEQEFRQLPKLRRVSK